MEYFIKFIKTFRRNFHNILKLFVVSTITPFFLWGSDNRNDNMTTFGYDTIHQPVQFVVYIHILSLMDYTKSHRNKVYAIATLLVVDCGWIVSVWLVIANIKKTMNTLKDKYLKKKKNELVQFQINTSTFY